MLRPSSCPLGDGLRYLGVVGNAPKTSIVVEGGIAAVFGIDVNHPDPPDAGNLAERVTNPDVVRHEIAAYDLTHNWPPRPRKGGEDGLGFGEGSPCERMVAKS